MKLMQKRLSPDDWFETYAHIASQYPYYRSEAPTRFSTRIDRLFDEQADKERRIDAVGALGFLCRGFLFGDTTMVRGIRRSPWLARPDGQGGWASAEIPRHGSQERSAGEVINDFKPALLKEMRDYVNPYRQVAILLSGGLDSRVAAGVLRELQECGDFDGDVVAITWGVKDSRDVCYSEEICRRFGWERVYLPLDAEQLRENIQVCAAMGAEVAPFHLHAMPRILDLESIDCVIAGSYGDSVGRAEFSGRRVWELKPTIGRKLDKLGLMRKSVRTTFESELREITYGYRKRVPGRTEGQYREIEQQMHYMRRRNQTPLSLIAEHVPLYQLFSSPESCGVMWALDFNARGDDHYQRLLPTLPGKLQDIPWARTGRPLGNTTSKPDQLSKSSHAYGRWLRRELGSEIAASLKSPALLGLNLFNSDTLNWLSRIWTKSTTRSVNTLDETVAWLSALALFVERHDIKGLPAEDHVFVDMWESAYGCVYATTYQKIRNHLRN